MAKTDKSIWVRQGYSLFSENGPSGVKVEILARRVGKSKSSFYHYFSDVESFISLMLKLHIVRASELAKALESTGKEKTDYISGLQQFKDDILFHRQLRFHRHHSSFFSCINQAYTCVEEPAIAAINLAGGFNGSKTISLQYLQLVVDLFLYRLIPEKLDSNWVDVFCNELDLFQKGIQ